MEVSALLNGVNTLLPAANNESLPRYAQSTISRFLMINDSFDIVGLNRTVAPTVGVGKTTGTAPSLIMQTSASANCFIDVEEHKDSGEEEKITADKTFFCLTRLRLLRYWHCLLVCLHLCKLLNRYQAALLLLFSCSLA